MIYLNGKLYRWTDKQLNKFADKVKNALAVFLREYPTFKEMTDYLPKQKGKAIFLIEISRKLWTPSLISYVKKAI